MTDTVAFGGKTANLMPRYDRPRLTQNIVFRHFPRSSKTRAIDLGNSHGSFQTNAFFTEATTSAALTTLDAWQDLEGTNGTVTYTIAGNIYAFTHCYLISADKISRSGETIAIRLSFVKVQ